MTSNKAALGFRRDDRSPAREPRGCRPSLVVVGRGPVRSVSACSSRVRRSARTLPCASSGPTLRFEVHGAPDRFDADATARGARHERLQDRRESWVVDVTLIPTRDLSHAAKSKHCRWWCSAQIVIRRRDLWIVATTAGGPGNRNDPLHDRGSRIEALCREHRRVLADGGYRGINELVTPLFRRNRIIRDRTWRHRRRRRAGSKTPSLGSRTGASCATTADADAASLRPSTR